MTASGRGVNKLAMHPCSTAQLLTWLGDALLAEGMSRRLLLWGPEACGACPAAGMRKLSCAFWSRLRSPTRFPFTSTCPDKRSSSDLEQRHTVMIWDKFAGMEDETLFRRPRVPPDFAVGGRVILKFVTIRPCLRRLLEQVYTRHLWTREERDRTWA